MGYLCDQVTDNFRIISPKDFRVLARAGYIIALGGVPGRCVSWRHAGRCGTDQRRRKALRTQWKTVIRRNSSLLASPIRWPPALYLAKKAPAKKATAKSRLRQHRSQKPPSCPSSH